MEMPRHCLIPKRTRSGEASSDALRLKSPHQSTASGLCRGRVAPRVEQAPLARSVEQSFDARRRPGLGAGCGANALTLQLSANASQSRFFAFGGIMDGRDQFDQAL